MADTDPYDSNINNTLLDSTKKMTDDDAAKQTAADSSKPAAKSTPGAKPSGAISDIQKTIKSKGAPKTTTPTAPATAASGAAGTTAGGAISNIAKTLGSFKEGGTVPKTGDYKLHANEEVLPVGRASEYRKLFKQRGVEGKHKWGGK